MDLSSNDDNLTNDVIQWVTAEEIQPDDLLSLHFVCEVQGDDRMNITSRSVRSHLFLIITPMQN